MNPLTIFNAIHQPNSNFETNKTSRGQLNTFNISEYLVVAKDVLENRILQIVNKF